MLFCLSFELIWVEYFIFNLLNFKASSKLVLQCHLNTIWVGSESWDKWEGGWRGRNGVPKLKVANSFDRIMMPSIRDDCLLASYPLRWKQPEQKLCQQKLCLRLHVRELATYPKSIRCLYSLLCGAMMMSNFIMTLISCNSFTLHCSR